MSGMDGGSGNIKCTHAYLSNEFEIVEWWCKKYAMLLNNVNVRIRSAIRAMDVNKI